MAIAVSILGLSALVARLENGPINLDPVVERFESAMMRDLAALGYDVKVGSARLGIGAESDPAPEFHANDVELRDPAGNVLGVVPEIRFGFRPLDLLRGEVRLTSVHVERPEVRLIRDADQGLVADLSPPGGHRGDGPPAIGSLVSAFLKDAPGMFADLTVVHLDAATVSIIDRDAEKVSVPADLTLRRTETGIELDMTVSAASGAEIALDATVDQSGAVDGRLTFAEVPVSDLHALHQLGSLDGLEQRISGQIDVALDPSGQVIQGRLAVAVSGGAVPTGTALGTVMVDALELAARFDGSKDRFTLEHFLARGPIGSLALSGDISLDRDQGEIRGATVALALGKTSLPLHLPTDASPTKMATFDNGSLTARLDMNSRRLDIAEIFLRRGDLAASLGGQVAMPDGDVATARLTGSIRDASLADLKALWPPRAAPGALRWISRRMEAGHVTEATFSLSGPLLAPEVALEFAFVDGVARPLPPLPPITGRGWGRVTDRDFSLTLEEGSVTVAGEAGGEITLDGSSFLLDSLSNSGEPAQITVLGTGPLPAILTLIDEEPLGLLARMPLDPGAIEGTGTVTAALSVPLLRDLRLSQIGVEAEASLFNAALSLDHVRPDLVVEAPRLTLSATAQELAMSGDLQLAGGRLAMRWQEIFSPEPGELRTKLALEGPVDLGVLGFSDLPRGVALRAPLPMTLTLTRDADVGTGFDLSANLATARLEAAALGWVKEPGVAGRLRARGRLSAVGTRVDTLTLDAGALSLRGGARLDSAGRLRQAEISRLTIGDATDIRGTLTQQDGNLNATVRGARLELGALLGSEAPSPSGGGGFREARPLSLALEVDALGLGEGRVLRRAQGTLNRDAAGATDVMLAGAMGGAAPAALRISLDAAGEGDVTLTSPDAGGLLRETGLARRAIGGEMTARATIARPDQGPLNVRGTAEIEDLVVIEDGALDKMLTQADLATAIEALRHGGIRFDRVRLPFRWTQGSLRLDDAVAHGPVVGLTLSGDYDLAADKLNMAGVFTPLYGLSSAIGHVPLIGTILTGGEGQGLIAFTFDLGGSVADPNISINPLSALLPGVLRQLVQPRPTEG